MQERGKRKFPVRVCVTLASMLVVSGNAAAANNVVCDKAARTLASDDTSALKVENVDHVPPLADLDVNDRLTIQDVSGSTPSAVPPLSPQLESMLESVFAGDEEGASADKAASSPLADSVKEQSDSGVDDSALDVSPENLSVQQQMFRKDI